MPSKLPPPSANLSTGDLPILKKLTDSYKLWHTTLIHLPKLSRYTLGNKIDKYFTETIEIIFLAGYASRPQKNPLLQRASHKLDTLKFFLQLAWELKILKNQQYLEISTPLTEVGKMLGGWQRQLSKEIPAI